MLTIEEHKILTALFSSNNISTTWKNFCHTSQLSNTLRIKIHTVAELQKVLNTINELNKQKDSSQRITCRAAAGGHHGDTYSASYSLTPIVEADVIFNLLLDDDRHSMQLVRENNQDCVKVKAGVQIHALDAFLQRNQLRTQSPASLIGYVTAVGLAAVGGHGTDCTQGGYADNIESLTLVKMDGALATIKRGDPDFETIFAAHLGQFGIVTEMTLRCVPAEKLECHQTKMSLPVLLEKLKTQSLLDDAYSMYSLFYVPTYQHDAANTHIQNISVKQYKAVSATTPNQNEHYLCQQIKETQEAVGTVLVDWFNIPDNTSRFPLLMEAYMQHVVAASAIGESRTIVGPYATVYHYQHNFPHEINDLDGMFAVSADYHEIAGAFEKLAALLHAADAVGEAPVTYGVYVRLIKNNPTQRSISPAVHACDKPFVCGFDIVSSPHATGFEKFRDQFVTFLIDHLHAKLHWGKYVPLNKKIDYQKMYGENLVHFRQALERWHGNDVARSPFLTSFFCDVLQMPEYKPAERPVTQPASSASCCSLFPNPQPAPANAANAEGNTSCCAML